MKNPLGANGEPILTFSEIKQNLLEDIETKYIRAYNKGGAQVQFLNVTDIKDLMDQRAGIWTHRIASVHNVVHAISKFRKEAEDNRPDRDITEYYGELYMVVEVTIFAKDGVFTVSADGYEETPAPAYGETSTNAFKRGLARCCESLGLGRKLKRKEEQQTAKAKKQELANQDIQKLTPDIIKMFEGKGISPEAICWNKYKCKLEELDDTKEKALIEILKRVNPRKS